MDSIRILEEMTKTLQQISPDQLDAVVPVISQHKGNIFLAGCGRTGYMLRCFAMRLHHMGFSAHCIGDTTCPCATAGDLLVMGSGSGETERLISYGKKGESLGLTTLVFTTRETSTLANHANYVVTIPAGNKLAGQGLQPMGALFEQCLLVLLDTLVLTIMEQNHIPSQDMVARHANLE